MTTRIISHEHSTYMMRWGKLGANRHNGAFYYSREIVRNIIPNVKTDRPWVTINIPGECVDRAIVFIHNNIDQTKYEWLKRYDDLILVCGVEETCDKVSHLGTALHLPLSIDVSEVKRYMVPEDKRSGRAAFAGRSPKKMMQGVTLPSGLVYLEDLPREQLLKNMAAFKTIYAIGRTAVEAKALGCTIAPYDPRYPDPELWKVIDNLEAARILQDKLNQIERKQ